jgi:pimeloyl-ACP methyl ester carboxylesterase
MPPLPKTQYTKSGDLHIAYQVTGSGPLDLVFVPGFVSHLECQWEHPWSARFLERLGSFSRLIRFDKRGTGLSDRVGGIPTLEQRMDDVRAVMDAVGSARAALFGVSEGGPMSVLFAATYPERTSALVLYGSYARRAWAPEHPAGRTEQEWREMVDTIEKGWGDPGGLALTRRELARFRGREVDTAGDGFFASFDGPARGIRCAQAIATGARPLGIEVRAGLHTGECEVLGEKVGGIAVHIGARVAGLAKPGEVLVSNTVRDLVAGSGLSFEDRGQHTLKGVPGEWRLYAVAPTESR